MLGQKSRNDQGEKDIRANTEGTRDADRRRFSAVAASSVSSGCLAR